MDKVLAFSILSASSADIAGSGGWARLSWRGKKQTEEDHQAGAEQQQRRNHGGHPQPPLRPRFAPEFDGIDCFETIVASH